MLPLHAINRPNTCINRCTSLELESVEQKTLSKWSEYNQCAQGFYTLVCAFAITTVVAIFVYVRY